jgi:hypothetical protein
MKPGKLLAVVGLLAVILVAGYIAFFSGGGGPADVPQEKVRRFLCVDKACGKAFADEELNLDDAGPYGEAGVMAVRCPACGRFSVFTARTCPHCDALYVPTLATQGPAGDLKCPQCGKAPE